MRKISLSILVAFSGLLTHPSTTNAVEKVMYRWVDERGKVYFSDVVPPDQIQHKREARDENARILDVVDKAKSSEELNEIKRLEALRQEQRKLISQQQTSDKTLLSTYRSAEDMQAAEKSRLSIIDNEKKLLVSLLERYEKQLQQQQQQAADDERNARPVSQQLVADIASTKQQIETTKQELYRQTTLRQQVEKEFEADIARYQFLTQEAEQRKNKPAENSPAQNLGLFLCDSLAQCDQAWAFANEFANQYSTTGPDVSSDKLIMRAPPQHDQDISLSISKLTLNNQPQLFLDVRCKNSSIGVELCASNKVLSIRQNFVPYLRNRLAAQH